MWNVAVLAVLIAVAGVVTTRNFQALDHAHGALAGSTAAEMGIYRGAVRAYFRDHDDYATSAATAALKSGGYLPSWSRMFQQTTPLDWSNYRAADGVIYVYAATLPDQNVAAELDQLADHSLLVGVYGATGTLQSPAAGDTGISLSALAGKAVAGVPVWIAINP